VSLAVVVALAGGGTFVALESLQRNIRTVDLTPMLGDRPSAAPVNPDGGRPVTILVMGSDSRAGDNGFVGGEVQPPKSDSTLVVHLSADRSRAIAVSIPRDSLVEIPDCRDSVTETTVPGSRRMFNNAFETGGPACTLRTVEHLTGVRIDHWVVVDFNGFTKVVDALGTVPICLDQPVNDTKHNIHLPAGRSEVDGKTALAYVRERYELGDGGDLGRIQRQQAFISSVLQKATSAGTLANPAKTYAVLEAVTSSLVMNPELASLPRLAAFGQDVQRIGLHKIRFVTVPTGPAPDDPNRLIWTDQAEALWTAVRDDRPVLDREAAGGSSASSSRSGSTKGSGTVSSPGRSGSAEEPSPTASPSPAGVVLDRVPIRSADTDICPS
jgi:LCP family protein required for cell wall assembly